MRKQRHIPQRTCVACRQTGDRHSFVRFVRRPDGTVALDPSGKEPGRGAYLCCRTECAADPRKWQKLGRSLSVSLSPTREQELEGELRQWQRDAATEAN
ncbi:MAG TPA: YlxR family protein [Armatimonadota bacterium]|nr:YlxR family protein [Armatimonadota bacterium]